MTCRLNLAAVRLLPADVLLTRDRGRVSRLIRAGEILRDEDGVAEFSHAELINPPRVIGSMWRIREAPLAIYDGAEVVIWRRRDLTDVQRGLIASAALSQLRKHYGAFKLVLFALDAICGTTWFTWRLSLTNFKVCSQFVAWCHEIRSPGVFGRPWNQVSPDDIDDWCLAHPEAWQEVFCSLRYRGSP